WPFPKRGPDLRIERLELRHARVRGARTCEAVNRVVEQPRDPGEGQPSREEVVHGDVVGRDQGSARPWTGAAGLACDTERGETRLVRPTEGEPPDLREIDGGHGRWSAFRVRDGVLDRDVHVGD